MAIRCDVLVAGAGVAGVPAAVAAARRGLCTVVVDRNSFPGGSGVAGLHTFICGLYACNTESPGLLHDSGIVREIRSALEDRTGVHSPVRMGAVHLLPCSPFHLEAVYATLLGAEPRIEAYFNTSITSVIREGNTITAVVLDSSGKVVVVEPRFVIDCTGDGAVLQMADVPRLEPTPGQCQMAGFTMRVTGLVEVDDMLSIAVPYHLARGVRRGTLPPHLKFTTFTPGTTTGEGFCKLGLPPIIDDSRNERALADADRVHRFLSGALPAFRDSRISETSPYVLDREGPRLLGEYVLTEEDVVSGGKFPDSVVRNAWPIEFWHPEKGPRYRHLAAGQDCYEIPVRCLRSSHVRNLLCAGRCISVSSRALGSTRVMGACMALGEAAGITAAETA